MTNAAASWRNPFGKLARPLRGVGHSKFSRGRWRLPRRAAAVSDVVAAKTLANRAKDGDALPELMVIEREAEPQPPSRLISASDAR